MSTPSKSDVRRRATRRKVAVVIAGVLALGMLGFVAMRDGAGVEEPLEVQTGTVTNAPSRAIDVVDLSTPEQAAIAVSSRLFDTADLAILTDDTSKADAIASATRLKVPVLLDDSAAPAELTRLRATTVLTFGAVEDVFGGVPAQTDPDALDTQIAALQAELPATDPQADAAQVVDAVVLMASTKTFDVAAASAKIAGATVVQSTQGDVRTDAKTAALLAERPDSPVIALGEPFTGSFAYSLSAVQKNATQIGGGYFALPDRRFVGLHGAIGDPDSGMLGQQDTAASITLIKSAASKFAANDSVPIVPMFEIVATPDTTPAELEPTLAAAQEAGLYVLIDLQPGSSTFLAQAKTFEDLLTGKNVGLTLEPALREGSTDAAEINQVSAWLADLTASNALPQKLFVVREPSPTTVQDRADIDTSRPELAVVLGVDVAGDPNEKLSAWSAARADAPSGASFGWMQYKSGDQPLFTVNQTYKLVAPYPSVVTYQ